MNTTQNLVNPEKELPFIAKLEEVEQITPLQQQLIDQLKFTSTAQIRTYLGKVLEKVKEFTDDKSLPVEKMGLAMFVICAFDGMPEEQYAPISTTKFYTSNLPALRNSIIEDAVDMINVIMTQADKEAED